MMRKFIKTCLRILDGAPQADKQSQRGQSLLELAFITPLLIIMVAGTVEIGWFANHYLVLLEVTRVGARAATGLTGDLAPLSWNESASIHPVVYRDVLDPVLGETPAPEATQYRNCQSGEKRFYNFIACNMINSLEPLTVKGRAPYETTDVSKIVYDRFGQVTRTIPYPDDIVVSVFSLQAINNADPDSVSANFPSPPAPSDPDYDTLYAEYRSRYLNVARIFNITYNFDEVGSITEGIFPAGHQVIVVGRYPTTANECQFFLDINGDLVFDVRDDPFDYIPDDAVNTQNVAGTIRAVELTGRDSVPEAQVGFVWTAQHRVSSLDELGRPRNCYGSEWDSAEIQRLFNLPGFIWDAVPPEPDFRDYVGGAADPNYIAALDAYNTAFAQASERAQFLPSQGVVLVEMFWMHEMLLNFPFLNPILNLFSDVDNIVISVWAMFPVPGAEPNITYRLASPPVDP